MCGNVFIYFTSIMTVRLFWIKRTCRKILIFHVFIHHSVCCSAALFFFIYKWRHRSLMENMQSCLTCARALSAVLNTDQTHARACVCLVWWEAGPSCWCVIDWWIDRSSDSRCFGGSSSARAQGGSCDVTRAIISRSDARASRATVTVIIALQNHH